MVESPHHDPLVTLATRLSGASVVDDVVATALDLAPGVLEADGVVLALPTESGRRLRLYERADGAEPSTDADPLAISESSPLARAVRRGEPLTVDAGSSPDWQRELQRYETFLALPLEAMVGVTGGIGFGWEGRREVSEADRAGAAEVAQWVGLALERALARERERRFVRAIRGDLFRSFDLGDAVDAFGVYRPPWSGAPVGGDWYDAFVLPDGVVLIVVGDVAGHGVDVAPTMLQIRSYVRSIAVDERDPAACLHRLEVAMSVFEGEGALVSLLIAFLDPRDGRLHWVNGGLPAPVVRHADGATKVLASGRARLVGTGMDRSPDASEAMRLAPGDLLVLYTDGVTTPADATEVTAETVAGAVAEHGAGSLERLCEELVQLSEHGELRTDDATVVAVRIR